jgi:outer membrane protein assembly factor BamB
MKRGSLVTVGLIWLALVAVPAANQWPQFRGSDAGVAPDHPALPHTWSETENVVWKADIPGLGWSSPVVWGNHVFVTTAISAGVEPQPVKGLYDPGDVHGKTDAVAAQRWMVYDIDFETGEVRWQQELHEAVPTIKRHLKASFASETTTTDGERVYVYLGSIGLVVALDMTGTIVWSRDLAAFNGHQEFAPAASPVLHEDRLYVINDNTTESFLIALDTATGDTVWRVVREETENWSTPMVWENDLRTEIVTTGRNKVRSYALDGTVLWELRGMTGNVAPTPFAKDGLVYFSSGYPGSSVRPVYAVRPGGAGDISIDPDKTTDHPYIAWFQPLLGTYVTSALVYGGIYYTLLDRGLLWAHDATTGEEVYGRQRLKPGSGFTASPWAYNGKVFVLSEDGDTYVIQAGPEFDLLGTNSLNEMALATPAVAGDSLILRTQSKLYRLSKRDTP